MVKIKKHIEIVRTSSAGLSSIGLKSTDALCKLLKKHYAVVGISTVNSVADLKTVVNMKPDLVFTGLKYLPGSRPHSKVWVSAFFTRHGISHTGSAQQAIEVEQDKSLAKLKMIERGIATSPFTLIKRGQTHMAADRANTFPLFVKPASLGAGQGVDDKSIVHNQVQLNTKLSSLFSNYKSDVLVEKYLSGREFSVAVLKDEFTDNYTAMPIELLPGKDVNGDKMLSHRLKSGALETPVRAVTNPILRARLMTLATQAFHAIGARDYGRIDIRLDANGAPHFLEANLIPCIIEGSGNFPKACWINQGIDYETMILRIVNMGLIRAERAKLDLVIK